MTFIIKLYIMTFKSTRNINDFTFKVLLQLNTPEQSKAASVVIFYFADPNAEHQGIQTIKC
jgi:hypothetical protein